jgi:multiple sugar transport system ATP-binding protein
MDEPLSNLDAKLRVQMRAEIAHLQRDLGVTTIYVTHDQVEAMTMGDRVAVMRRGELQQVDDPQTLYDRPLNLFVGGFIGSPAMNMVPARLETEGDKLFAIFGTQRIVVPREQLSQRRQLINYKGKDVILGVRPEDFEDVELVTNADPDAILDVEVALAEPMGAEIVAHFEVDSPPVKTRDARDLMTEVDEDGISTTGKALFTARLDPKSSARDGRPLKVVADVTRLYFFDPETEAAIW